jgi:hypothetical protein
VFSAGSAMARNDTVRRARGWPRRRSALVQ